MDTLKRALFQDPCAPRWSSSFHTWRTGTHWVQGSSQINKYRISSSKAHACLEPFLLLAASCVALPPSAALLNSCLQKRSSPHCTKRRSPRQWHRNSIQIPWHLRPKAEQENEACALLLLHHGSNHVRTPGFPHDTMASHSRRQGWLRRCNQCSSDGSGRKPPRKSGHP